MKKKYLSTHLSLAFIANLLIQIPAAAQVNVGVDQAYPMHGMPWNRYNMQPTGGMMQYRQAIPGQYPMTGQHLQTVPPMHGMPWNRYNMQPRGGNYNFYRSKDDCDQKTYGTPPAAARGMTAMSTMGMSTAAGSMQGMAPDTGPTKQQSAQRTPIPGHYPVPTQEPPGMATMSSRLGMTPARGSMQGMAPDTGPTKQQPQDRRLMQQNYPGMAASMHPNPPRHQPMYGMYQYQPRYGMGWHR